MSAGIEKEEIEAKTKAKSDHIHSAAAHDAFGRRARHFEVAVVAVERRVDWDALLLHQLKKRRQRWFFVLASNVSEQSVSSTSKK